MAELTRNLAINKDLNNSEINVAAGQYLQLTNQWANLAGNALRLTNPIFDRVKTMLNSQYQADRQNSFATDETNSQRLERFSSRDNFTYRFGNKCCPAAERSHPAVTPTHQT